MQIKKKGDPRIEPWWTTAEAFDLLENGPFKTILFYISFKKSIKGALSGLKQILATKSLFQILKNTFYFTLKYSETLF